MLIKLLAFLNLQLLQCTSTALQMTRESLHSTFPQKSSDEKKFENWFTFDKV